MAKLLVNHKVYRQYSRVVVNYDLVVVKIFTDPWGSNYLYW